MTALMAALGLLPMALSTRGRRGNSRPFAVVIIGGLVTATFVTLLILLGAVSAFRTWETNSGNRIQRLMAIWLRRALSISATSWSLVQVLPMILVCTLLAGVNHHGA